MARKAKEAAVMKRAAERWEAREDSRGGWYVYSPSEGRAVTGWGCVLQSEADALLLAAAPAMRDKLAKAAAWADKLADQARAQWKSTPYVTIREAAQADEKNFRATAASLRAAMPPAASPG